MFKQISIAATAALLVLGCGDDGVPAAPSSSSSSTHGPSSSSSTTVDPPSTSLDSTGTGVGTVGATSVASTGTSSSSSGSSSSGPDSSGSSSSGTTDGTDSEGSSSSGGGMPFMCPPGGGMACASGAECASGECYVVGPLGGVCSECDSDSDCAFGCSPGNPLSGECATCCDGSLGCGCESGAACLPGLFCTQLIDVPGIFDVSTCSQCQSDGDCMGGELCSPDYDLNMLRGQYTCVPPGTKANDEGCDVFGSGNQQCASGNCASVALMGIPVTAVCAECNEDADCPGGTCMLPELAIVGTMLQVVPGACI